MGRPGLEARGVSGLPPAPATRADPPRALAPRSTPRNNATFPKYSLRGLKHANGESRVCGRGLEVCAGVRVRARVHAGAWVRERAGAQGAATQECGRAAGLLEAVCHSHADEVVVRGLQTLERTAAIEVVLLHEAVVNIVALGCLNDRREIE